MTITYSSGKEVEAVLLSRSEDTMRLAVAGADDVMEFVHIRGTWVSTDCEPVSIRFAWQRRNRQPIVLEDECYCSHELAAKLVHALVTGSNDRRRALELPMAPRMFAARLSD